MAHQLIGLYHRSPLAARSLLASMKGYYLNWWRYSRVTNHLVTAAIEREFLDPTTNAERVERDLATILGAARTSGAYPTLATVDPTTPPRAQLASLPILTKDELRERNTEFWVASRRPLAALTLNTSGSTGTPIQIRVTRSDLRRWYALFEARWRRWNEVSRQDRWAIIGGQLVVPQATSSPPFWVKNSGMKQLYLSSIHLNRSTAPDYLLAIKQFKPKYILGYSSAIADLARFGSELELEPPRLSVILTNAEPLLDDQRDQIEAFFECPVRETYGMAEMVAGASECQYGLLHLWPEAGIVEVLDEEDRPVEPGTTGRLICTGLVNTGTPLLRYEIGDRGALAAPDTKCRCGRTLPVLKSVEGRLDDVVISASGYRIGRLDTVFKSSLPIQRAQIIQNVDQSLVVKVLPAHGYSERSQAEIGRALRERVGDLGIRFELVTRLPKGPNGKFRGVISEYRDRGTLK